ncbi:MAG: hypothetical protein ACOX6J_03745 [Oscillospiraceae bacterium]|jgi:hypothetical protein
MIALARKNLSTLGYGKLLLLFAGCLLFSIGERMDGGINYEQHLLSAVSDHYYLTFLLLPIVLLSCFSFIEDDGEPVLLRFQSYHSYFMKKWAASGSTAALLTAAQTGAVLLSGAGLPFGNNWSPPADSLEAEYLAFFEQFFASPLQGFVFCTIYQLMGTWLIFGICMWIAHFTGRKWTVRITAVIYIFSAGVLKIPELQDLPLTGFDHLLILHHNLGTPHRFMTTIATALLIILVIALTVRLAWRWSLPQVHISRRGISGYYFRELMVPRNLWILFGVVLIILMYEGLKVMYNGTAIEGIDWIYVLFAGHGTGYFLAMPFLEMLITSGAPIYLLAAFVEQTVNGQSMFVTVRSRSRRNLLNGILSVSTRFLMIYAVFWLVAGLIGTFLFSTGITASSFWLLIYAVVMKFLDLFSQYLMMLGIYIASGHVTIGFLALVAGNLLCIPTWKWTKYLPIGLSSLTRISVLYTENGIPAASALGIEAAVSLLLMTCILVFGRKKI